ncbi:HNH endonuclease signature motif containing protein [Desulfovibrio sp. UCD-KL4C]|uniref:HNH endonuclease n=1 Tax=Desulfovibrio sp. UCD-KL4C TaxID=2578120 RepID=UPI0025B95EF9|nr:HNH endonuclease signature motif containing protein [Desulfovibrio sp. UCD-KL4C]
MTKFRNKPPKRREDVSQVTKYQKYRLPLKEDFNRRCGYCDEPDHKRDSHFHIDHFVPQALMEKITPTDYSNLVYACSYCNIAKSCKWPTKDEYVHNYGNEGFVDPCSSAYTEHIGRKENGCIYPKSDLGKYMFSNLKLYLNRHSFIWLTEQIELKIISLSNILETLDEHDPVAHKIATITTQYIKIKNTFEKLQ